MTCIVAVKDDYGTVSIGSDMRVDDDKIIEDLKLKKIFNFKSALDNIIIATAGAIGVNNILDLNGEFKLWMKCEKPYNPKEWIYEKLVPKINDKLFSDGVTFRIFELIVIINNQIYKVQKDGTIMEIDKYASIGSCESLMIGSLSSTLGDTSYNRCKIALDVASKHAKGINTPFHIVTIKENNILEDMIE